MKTRRSLRDLWNLLQEDVENNSLGDKINERCINETTGLIMSTAASQYIVKLPVTAPSAAAEQLFSRWERIQPCAIFWHYMVCMDFK